MQIEQVSEQVTDLVECLSKLSKIDYHIMEKILNNLGRIEPPFGSVTSGTDGSLKPKYSKIPMNRMIGAGA